MNTKTLTYASESGSGMPLFFLKLLLVLAVLLNSTAETRAQPRAVIIGAPPTMTGDIASGIDARSPYSSGESIYTSAEIGTGGIITSFALYKYGGLTSGPIDGVYIYMKETSSDTVSDRPALDGYTLVYSGILPNGMPSGWIGVPLSRPFSYTGTANLSVLLVRYRGTPMGGRQIFAGVGISSSRYFFSGPVDYWSGWGSSSGVAMAPGIPTNFRPSIQLNIYPFPPCSGKPVAGKVTVSGFSCTTGSPTSFVLSGSTLASGLTYSWDTSATGTGGWALAGGSISTSGLWRFTPPGDKTLYYRCRVSCGSLSDTSEALLYRPPSSSTLPYLETFESVPAGNNAPCAGATLWGVDYWYTRNGLFDPSIPSLNNHTPGGSRWLMGRLLSTHHLGGRDYWFTPALQLNAGQAYHFSYWYNTNGISVPGYEIELGAYIGNAQTAAAMTVAIGPDITPGAVTSYRQYATEFTVPGSGTYYIGIYSNVRTAHSSLAIDDIGLQEILPCSAPVTAGVIDAKPSLVCGTVGTTTLRLTGSTVAYGLTYTWQSKTDTGVWSTVDTGKPPYITPVLTERSWFRCIVTCTASGNSDTTEAAEVFVGARNPPYQETFETVTPGENAECADVSSWGYRNTWYTLGDRYPFSWSLLNSTPGGSNWLMGGARTSLGTTKDFWFTPALKLQAGILYGFSYWYNTDGGAADPAFPFEFGAYIGNSQTVAGMTTAIGPVISPGAPTDYQEYKTEFSVLNDGIYYIGIYGKANNENGFAIDDINLNYNPCNGKPAAGTIRGSIPTGTSLCSGTSVTLNGIGATVSDVPGIRYQWERRNLSFPSSEWSGVSGADNISIAADTLVGYEYRLAVICDNTQDTVRTGAFAVPAWPAHPPVSISSVSTPVNYCLGDTVLLSATSFADAKYEWSHGDTLIPGWEFNELDVTEPGDYRVKVISALSHCPAYSEIVELRQTDPGFSVAMSKPADSIFCADVPVTLSAAGSKPGLSYQWQKDNTIIPGATDTNYLVTGGGYYRITATDSISACPAVSRTVKMVIKPIPEAAISIPGGQLSACAETGVLLEANRGLFSYQWLRSGREVYGWVDSAVRITSSGNYSVKIRTADGCTDVSTELNVNIFPGPLPVITRSGSGLSTVLSATPGYFRYEWQRKGVTGITTEGSSAELAVTKKGTYQVIVTDTNGCTGKSAPISIMDGELGIEGVRTADIRVYPNPSSAKVFIESMQPVEVTVKDITGRIILERQETSEINLEPLDDGLYILVISSPGEHRLLKQEKVNKVSR